MDTGYVLSVFIVLLFGAGLGWTLHSLHVAFDKHIHDEMNEGRGL